MNDPKYPRRTFPDESMHNDMLRRVFDSYVQWIPAHLMRDLSVSSWFYGVYKFPFVPGFHLCQIGTVLDDTDDDHAYILSSHKTLSEAMSICRLLLANGGVSYD